MIVIFLGPPGCGKGTQSKVIASDLGFKHFSTGDILREMSKKDNDLADELRKKLQSGELVSDELVNKVVLETLKDSLSYNIILDGYPRSEKQAQFLEDNLLSKKFVIYFDIDKDILYKRIEGRFSCSECGAIYNKYFSKPRLENVCDICGGNKFESRKDDNLDSLEVRLQEYNDVTGKLVDYYGSRNALYTINANQDSIKITSEIVDIIKSN